MAAAAAPAAPITERTTLEDTEPSLSPQPSSSKPVDRFFTKSNSPASTGGSAAAPSTVWPDHVERAFTEALTIFPVERYGGRRGRNEQGKISRNELIAQHIMKATGELRTKKQISSHIQLLKNRIEDASRNHVTGKATGAGGRPGADLEALPDLSLLRGQVTTWPEHIEAAFQEALIAFPHRGRAKFPGAGGKWYGRNEMISKHILERTGEVRDRKQVSSHIQASARCRDAAASTGTVRSRPAPTKRRPSGPHTAARVPSRPKLEEHTANEYSYGGVYADKNAVTGVAQLAALAQAELFSFKAEVATEEDSYDDEAEVDNEENCKEEYGFATTNSASENSAEVASPKPVKCGAQAQLSTGSPPKPLFKEDSGEITPTPHGKSFVRPVDALVF